MKCQVIIAKVAESITFFAPHFLAPCMISAPYQHCSPHRTFTNHSALRTLTSEDRPPSIRNIVNTANSVRNSSVKHRPFRGLSSVRPQRYLQGGRDRQRSELNDVEIDKATNDRETASAAEPARHLSRPTPRRARNRD